MKKLPDILVFLPLAAGLHLAAFHFAGGPDGLSSGQSGAGGDSVVTLAAVSPQDAELLRQWDQLPDASQSTDALIAPTTDQAPDRPAGVPEPLRTPPPPKAMDLPMPDLAPAPPPLPAKPLMPAPKPPKLADPAPVQGRSPKVADSANLHRAPAPPQPVAPRVDTAPRADMPPPPKPKPHTQPHKATKATKAKPEKAQKKPATPAPALRAKGSAKAGATAGSGQKTAPSLSKGQRNSLAAQWAGKVRAKVERRKRYPNAERRNGVTGRAVVSVTLAANGKVLGVNLVKSAGSSALDKAALAAAGANRFSSAPKGWDGRNVTFEIPINFSR